MSEDGKEQHQEIIIVRRGNHGDHDDHHGGVWKVAFADFMTAMMAFFLVLWIVNSTSKETRSSVARYFNPLQLSNTTPARKGLKTPDDSNFDAAATSNKIERGKKSAQDSKPKGVDPSDKNEQPAVPDIAKGESGDHDKKGESDKTGEGKDGKAEKGESDPKIFARLFPNPTKKTDSESKDGNTLMWNEKKNAGSTPGKTKYRDPFALLQPTLKRNGMAEPSQENIRKTVPAAPKLSDPLKKRADGRPVQPSPDGKYKQARRAQDAGRIDDTRKGPRPHNLAAYKKTTGIAPAQNSAKLKKQPNQIQKSRTYKAISALVTQLKGQPRGPNLAVDITKKGVRVSLMESKTLQMFEINSPKLTPNARRVVKKIAAILSRGKKMIIVQGHTDARPFRSGQNNNWLLSAARAEQAMVLLLDNGISADRIERIEGYADREPRNPRDRFAPENRRIDILIRK